MLSSGTLLALLWIQSPAEATLDPAILRSRLVEQTANAARFQGDVSVNWIIDGKEEAFIGTCSIRTNGDSRLYSEVVSMKSRRSVTLRAKNPRYIFEIGKKDPGDRSWVARETLVQEWVDAEVYAKEESRFFADLRILACKLYTLDNLLLSDLIQENRLTIAELRRDGNLLHVSFMVEEPTQPRSRPTAVKSGVMYLNPAMAYIVDYATLNCVHPNGTSRAEIKNEARMHDGRPVPTRHLKTSTFKHSGSEQTARDHYEIVFSNVSTTFEDDPAIFSLSHYGLPEPTGNEMSRPTPWFLYFSAGGFGLFFLALFLWRVLAKRQARGVA